MTLHEILDPTISSGGSKGYASNQLDKSAVVLASEITSISSTLGPRLPPGKLSTAVTANEDDLKRSLNSTIYLLSSSDWEKIVLTRVLAQIISTNQVIGSSIKQSMEGAVLLLDDMGIHMNEIQQARLLKNLRKSGAATLITSYRWSVGRFADRIYVLQNGAIVENGTHSELLDRGTQRSIYAARWKEMYDESK
jgi:ABC-type cobalamin transport system ATPase subunit